MLSVGVVHPAGAIPTVLALGDRILAITPDHLPDTIEQLIAEGKGAAEDSTEGSWPSRWHAAGKTEPHARATEAPGDWIQQEGDARRLLIAGVMFQAPVPLARTPLTRTHR
jgi:hypothetical protein